MTVGWRRLAASACLPQAGFRPCLLRQVRLARPGGLARTDFIQVSLIKSWADDMRYLILCLVFFACVAVASAKQVPAPYSLLVKLATEKSKANYEHAVYVWPWVKSPGAYPFKKGITVAHLVAAAGGLIKDERYPNLPSEYFPRTVSVIRPSSKDPDPTTSIYRFSLDWSKPDGGISECKFKLQDGDFVSISMSPSVP